jgi:hypothetical protein
MYIFEQLFSPHGYEYAIAVLAIFIFIVFYFILIGERKF